MKSDSVGGNDTGQGFTHYSHSTFPWFPILFLPQVTSPLPSGIRSHFILAHIIYYLKVEEEKDAGKE